MLPPASLTIPSVVCPPVTLLVCLLKPINNNNRESADVMRSYARLATIAIISGRARASQRGGRVCLEAGSWSLEDGR